MSLGSKTGLGVNFTGGGQTPGFSRLFLSSSRFFISSEVTSSPLGSTKLMGLFPTQEYELGPPSNPAGTVFSHLATGR